MFEYYDTGVHVDMFSTWQAFALIMSDGGVVTWEDLNLVEIAAACELAELKQGVDTIYSTFHAFAAKMKDESVVICGNAGHGGDSSRVQAELKQDLSTESASLRR